MRNRRSAPISARAFGIKRSPRMRHIRVQITRCCAGILFVGAPTLGAPGLGIQTERHLWVRLAKLTHDVGDVLTSPYEPNTSLIAPRRSPVRARLAPLLPAVRGSGLSCGQVDAEKDRS